MGPRRTAVNTLSYSTGSRSKSEAGRASASTIGTGVCECPRRTGPVAGCEATNARQGGVGGGWPTGKTGFWLCSLARARNHRPSQISRRACTRSGGE